MADDSVNIKQIKENTDLAADSTRVFTDVLSKSLDTLKLFSNTTIDAGKALSSMLRGLQNIASSQKDSVRLTQEQTKTFGLMTATILGASNAFDKFGNQEGLNTFGNQIDQLVATASKAKQPFEAFGWVIQKLGLNVVKEAGDTVGTLATKITNAAKAMAAAPDSALKLQNGFLQMSAAGGNLGRVFEQAGPHLNNLNNLLQQQTKMIAQASGATNTSVDTIVKYYTALGKIPGYLNENIQGIDAAGHSINMLSASVRLATATGQTEEDVLKDLSSAYLTYGESGEKALEFTAKIAELSQKYNIQIEDTRSFITDMANSFKFLGDNTSATSNLFDKFFENLKNTGLSARSSKDVIEDFGKSIGNLTIAQKAFLSARTGGPGGLMGAVQIEKEIREGHMDKVAERVRAALKQQFGRIVTQEEGSKSQAGAQEFVRQRMFLQQGPFGQIFGSGAEGEGKATRFLEALAKPEGKAGRTGAEILKDDMKRGADIANKSDTKLTQMNAELEGIKMFSGIIALNTAQKTFTPGTQNAHLRQQLLGGIVDAMKAGTEATTASKKTQQNDTSNVELTRAYKNLIDTVGLFKHSSDSHTNAIKNHTEAQQRIAKTKEINVGLPTMDANVAKAIQMKSIATNQSPEELTSPLKHKLPQPPQHITVQVNSVCPDCHKKFVAAPQQAAINNSPDFGPGF